MSDHFKVYGKKVTPPQVSIHPRVVDGRTRYPKVNTCKPPRGDKQKKG